MIRLGRMLVFGLGMALCLAACSTAGKTSGLTRAEVQERLAACRAAEPPAESADPVRFTPGSRVTPPQAIHRVRPDYPESMRQAKSMGRIVLDGVIDEKGCVRSLHVHDTSDADFGPAAIEAARQWLFQPATEDGRPIKVYYSLTINFDIEKGAPK